MYSISPLSVPPSPALAASRARRQRSNAVSRAQESEAEWDSTSAAADTSGSPTTSSLPPPWRDDELICPLAPDTRRTHAGTPTPANTNATVPSWVPVPIWPTDEDELQAVLAQFAFPTTGRKHRRSGEIVVDNSSTSVGSLPPAPPSASSGKRRGAIGPNRLAWCAHFMDSCILGHSRTGWVTIMVF
ncbi:hypothetical protein H4582DRAFT_2053784 [Lactarius indigo]|nr:hypothetical protein H4582DRAFT_2053784 [Lactarius indigo]